MICPQVPALGRAANSQKDTERWAWVEKIPKLGPPLARSLGVFREKPAQPRAQEADKRQSENFIWKLAVNASELLPCSSVAAFSSFLTTFSTFSPFTFFSLSILTSPWSTWFYLPALCLFLCLSAVLLALLAFTKQPAIPTEPDLTYLPILTSSLAVQWPVQR